MNIRRKLILAFVAVAFIEIVLGYISWNSNKKISDDIDQITASTKELLAGADMAILTTEIQSAAQELATRHRHSLANGRPEQAIAEASHVRIYISEKIERFQQQLVMAQAEANDRIRMSDDQNDEEEIEQAKNTVRLIDTIEKEFYQRAKHMNEYLEAMEKNPQRSNSLAEALESLLQSTVLARIQEYAKNAATAVQNESQQIDGHIRETNRIVVGSVGLSLFVAVFLGVYVARSISRPIEKLTSAVVELGRGKPFKTIDFKSNDEIGLLCNAFDRMASDLSTTTVSKAFVDNILNSMGDSLIVLDSNLTIRKVNRATLLLLGYEESELVGMELGVITKDAKSLTGVAVESVSKFELIYRTRDGREIPMSLSAAVMDTESHSVGSVVCVAQDMTGRNLMVKALLQAKEANESNRAKSEFLANMSHEIRTPMNGVIGMTELALDTTLTAEQREYLEIVKLSADSLLGVINDVLDFSKVEAGKLELNPINFWFQDSLDDDIRPLALRSDQKGLELTLYVQPDVPDALVGDPDRLRQVLTNLVSNAIKFTEQGDIAIQVEKESQTGNEVVLHFSVTDTGIGIPADKQEQIFEAFTQADGSTSRKYGGTGLGLAICSKLVNLMAGRIWVESEAGRGSIFHFTARFVVQENPQVTPVRSLPVDLTNMPVLIVDDNATNRRLLQKILTNWNMRPTWVSGGSDALAEMRRRVMCGDPFKLILLDAQMPGMDGFAVAAQIQNVPEFAGTVVMMLSSSDQHSESQRCLDSGIATYLVKPVRQSDLLNSIKASLNHLLVASASQSTEVAPVSIPREQMELSRGLHILVAEDNVVNQTLITRLLEKRGYSSVMSKNGKQAVMIHAAQRFDAVLMDVQMPEMNGFEATAAIRLKEQTTGEHIPIIALTAHAMKEDSYRCLQAGMDGYVSKPVRTEELFAAIESLVLRHSLIETTKPVIARIES